MRAISSLLALSISLPAMLSGAWAQTAAPTAIKPKVLVITMFEAPGDTPGEAQLWLEREELAREIAVPGLSRQFPNVPCNADGLCLLTTAMGYANAASSVSALVHSDLFDLSSTYFLIAGIAGVDPADGTLGSAHWARFAVDGGLQNEIDARDLPAGWTSGYVGFGAGPGEKPKSEYGSEVYRLNDKLVQRAFEITRDAELSDSDGAAAYRAAYAAAPANAPPTVSVCDTVSSDTWWHGKRLSDAMNDWTRLLTDGSANYCTTQQEDNATLTALKRGADAGRLDFERVAVLRTASNFDQEAPGQTPAESLRARSGGFIPSVTNAYLVGSKLTDAIIADWANWEEGVPDQ
ncbi:MAG: purine nucleoside permease [Rhizobiales bacterium]|nr:purine nucleoside permease [Hyphomicrobiales bacterium]